MSRIIWQRLNTVMALAALVSSLVLFLNLLETADTAAGTARTAAKAAVVAKALTKRVQLQTFQNCVRGNILSALQNGRAVERPPGRTEEQRRERIVVASHLFPILDCKQSQLKGNVELSEPQKQIYIALVLRGRAPIVNMGKIVGSRTSVLQGVESLDQAGKP